MKRKFFTVKRLGYYNRLVFSLVLCCLIPLTVLLSVSYANVKRSIRNEYTISQVEALRLNAKNVSNLLNAIVRTASVYEDNPYFSKYAQLSRQDAARYDSLRPPFSADDQIFLYDYLQLKMQVTNQLSQIKGLNPFFISRVELFDATKSTVIDDSRAVVPYENYPHSSVFRFLQEKHLSPFFSQPYSDSDGAWVMSLVVGNYQSDGYALVVTLDLKAFASYVYVPPTDKSFLVVHDDEGNFIMSNNDNVDGNTFDASSLDPDQFLVVKVEYGSPIWTYENFVDMNYVNGEIRRIYGRETFGFILILILVFVIAYSAARSLYRPIEDLLGQIQQLGIEDKDVTKDVFQVIKNYLSSSETEKTKMLNNLKSMTPYYNEGRLLEALYSTLPDEKSEIWDIVSGSYAVLAVSFMLQLETEKTEKVPFAPHAYLMERAEAAFGDHYVLAQDFSGKFYILVAIKESPDENSIVSFSTTVKREVEATFYRQTVFGISLTHKGKEELSLARKEADNALTDSILSANQEITVYRGNVRGGIHSTDFIDTAMTDLFRNLNSGNVQQCLDIWDTVLSDVGKLPADIKEGKLKGILFRFYNSIAELMISSNVVFPPTFSADYSALLKGDVFGPESHVSSHINECCARLSSARKDASSVDYVVQLIHSHYKENIGLANYAEMVNMNPDYLGRLFKQKTGWSFVDYVTKIRVDAAKELLCSSPSMKIKDVCRASGFSSSNYFIRVFKKTTGQTPKEYQAQKLRDR